MKKKEQEFFGVKEIARRAKVSIGTVDRVIHNRIGVTEKTRDKINDIINLLSPLFSNEATGFVNSCKEKNIPVVLIDTNLPGQNGLCYIGPHMYYSAYQAAHRMEVCIG